MNWKLSLFGLFMLCTVCLSLPSASVSSSDSSVSNFEEDTLAPHHTAARKVIRLLPNIMQPHRIRHENKKKSTHKAKSSRRADIDDMMEHLLRIRRQSMPN